MLQQAIRQAAEALEADFDYPATVARWLAIQFIDQNKAIQEYASNHQLTPLTSQAKYYEAQKFADQIYNTRLVFIESLLHDVQ